MLSSGQKVPFLLADVAFVDKRGHKRGGRGEALLACRKKVWLFRLFELGSVYKSLDLKLGSENNFGYWKIRL